MLGPMTDLKPLPEDWDRALAVGAHPYDMEYGAGAAVARWTGQGKTVVYCRVTSGEAGIDGLHPEEAGPLREQEQLAACAAVGVETCDFLRQPDGIVEYGVPLRRAIAEVVRRHRPEIVITGNFAPSFGPGMLNQADHIAVGRAVLDAVRDAGNRWIFPDQLTDGLEPWGGVRQVWAAASPNGRHYVDTTDSFDAGVASLVAHDAYIKGLGWEGWDPREFLEGFARQLGQQAGVPMAAGFEVFSLTWDPEEE